MEIYLRNLSDENFFHVISYSQKILAKRKACKMNSLIYLFIIIIENLLPFNKGWSSSWNIDKVWQDNFLLSVDI